MLEGCLNRLIEQQGTQHIRHMHKLMNDCKMKARLYRQLYKKSLGRYF